MSGAEKDDKKAQKLERDEYNARSVGYLVIALSSLVNLFSIVLIKDDSHVKGSKTVALSFGALTFGASVLVLVVDRTVTTFDLTKTANGNVEGILLSFFTFWWTAAVGYLTQVQGIAYIALNIYFSSWITWALCISTLNQWSASKDILTINELTSISETLKSWYIAALSSMVVTGSAVDFWLKTNAKYQDDAVFSFCLATFGTCLCWGWILIHMNFITCCQEGGWLEACSAWTLIAIAIVNCGVVTRDGGIGATLVGTTPQDTIMSEKDNFDNSFFFELGVAGALRNCSVVFWNTIDDTQSSFPIECPRDDDIPGSNLYVASWVLLGGSVSIALRWNAQRARSLIPTRSGGTAIASNTNAAVNEDDDDLDNLEAIDSY